MNMIVALINLIIINLFSSVKVSATVYMLKKGAGN